jgi:thymidine kinase
MFCGKTDELLRRLRRAVIAQQKIQVFKPGFDIRYSNEKVTSHAGNEYDAFPIDSTTEISAHLLGEVTLVAIDEAQFFDEEIIPVVQDLVDRGIRVIVGGLDMDFRGVPFGQMPMLLAQAEIVDKLHAICMVCGEEATRTQRLVDGEPAHFDDPIIIVGASEMYEARCRTHHQVPRGKKD